MHTPTDPATAEFTLPSGDALLAATLALMTAFARPAADARIGCAAQRALMARKIVSNLFFLRQHPALAPGLRQVVDAAHRHWQAIARDPEAPTALH